MEEDPWADAPISEPSKSARNSLENRPSETTFETPTLPEVDEGFGSSSTLPSIAPPPIEPAASEEVGDDDFGDDFEDFDTAPAAGPSGTRDGDAGIDEEAEDAFGDFGDFEEGDFEDGSQQQVEEVAVPPIPEEKLPSLSLRPFPSPPSLISQLTSLLSPLLDPSSSLFTDEPPRLASSSRQILPTETARDAYIQLASPPQLKPLDWTRSRVRREHLIHMGIPVNLDEVDSHLLSKLPALTISTNFGDMRRKERRSEDQVGSGGRREESRGSKGKARETESMPVSAVPREVNGEGKYGLGTRPELDVQRAEELCGIEEDQISILAPAALAKIQADLVQSSAQASSLLAHLLQLKDAQAHDAATYNGMISNLITNAANARSAQQAGSGGVFRRTSVRRPVSTIGPNGGVGSGSVTPRTSSPAMK